MDSLLLSMAAPQFGVFRIQPRGLGMHMRHMRRVRRIDYLEVVPRLEKLWRDCRVQRQLNLFKSILWYPQCENATREPCDGWLAEQRLCYFHVDRVRGWME